MRHQPGAGLKRPPPTPNSQAASGFWSPQGTRGPILLQPQTHRRSGVLVHVHVHVLLFSRPLFYGNFTVLSIRIHTFTILIKQHHPFSVPRDALNTGRSSASNINKSKTLFSVTGLAGTSQVWAGGFDLASSSPPLQCHCQPRGFLPGNNC